MRSLRSWLSVLLILCLAMPMSGCVTSVTYGLGIYDEDEEEDYPGCPPQGYDDDDDDDPSIALLPLTLAIDIVTAPIQIWFWPLLFDDDDDDC